MAPDDKTIVANAVAQKLLTEEQAREVEQTLVANPGASAHDALVGSGYVSANEYQTLVIGGATDGMPADADATMFDAAVGPVAPVVSAAPQATIPEDTAATFVSAGSVDTNPILPRAGGTAEGMGSDDIGTEMIDEYQTIAPTPILRPDEARQLVRPLVEAPDEVYPSSELHGQAIDAATSDQRPMLDEGKAVPRSTDRPTALFVPDANAAASPIDADATMAGLPSQIRPRSGSSALGSSPSDPSRPGSMPSAGMGGANPASRPWTSASGSQPGASLASPSVAEPGKPRITGRGRYQVVREFARGGLGCVSLGRDLDIARDVAIKELLPNALHVRGMSERFLIEAQVTGQLEHPGIVPIYELGRNPDGTPFYSMKLLSGRTLGDAINEYHKLPDSDISKPLRFNQLLNVFIGVCNALGYAHAKGVLHRDLKPLNVMVGEYGEAIVVDWGLAKVLGRSANPQDHNQENLVASKDLRRAEESKRDTLVEHSEVVPDAEAAHDGTMLGNTAARAAIKSPASKPASGGSWRDSGNKSASVKKVEDGKSQSGAKSQSGGKSQANIKSSLGGKSQLEGKSQAESKVNPVTGVSSNKLVKTSGDDDQSRTLAGQVMGTPAYMPPEQAGGEIDRMDGRADVFALGAILYTILTNQPPYVGKTVQEVLFNARLVKYDAPRKIKANVPRALDAICVKALAERPEDRYQTAVALADDVGRWLANEPVSAFTDPWYVAAARWARKHRMQCIAVVTAGAVLIAALGAWHLWEQQRVARLRHEGLQLLTSGKDALQRGALPEAKEQFSRAIGLVNAEPELDSLKAELMLAERNRLEQFAESTRRGLLEGQRAFSENRDDDARLKFTEVINAAQTEPELAALQTEATKLLKQAEERLAHDKERENVKKRLARFRELRFEAIFRGTLAAGLEKESNMKLAREAAESALATFRITQQGQELRPDDCQYMSEKEIEDIRAGYSELLLVLANALIAPTANQPPAERQHLAREALKVLEKFPAKATRYKAYHLCKARCLDAAGNATEAALEVGRAAAIQPTTASDFFLVGEEFYKNNDYVRAIANFEQSMRLDANNFLSQFFIATCYLGANRWVEATVSLQACLAQKPNFAWLYLQRGFAYGQLGEFAASDENFAKALELADSDKDVEWAVYVNRSGLRVTRQNWVGVQSDVKKALELRPQRSQPLLNLAESYLRQRDYDQALKAINQALVLQPNNPDALLKRGMIERRRRDHMAALASLDAAIRLLPPKHPDVAEAHLERAYIFLLDKRYKEALVACDEATKVNIRYPGIQRVRADALIALNRGSEALPALDDYLRQADPAKDAEAFALRGFERYKQAKLLSAKGESAAAANRNAEAIADFTRTIEAEPADPATRARRGWALLNEGAKMALADFDAAIKVAPHDADLYNGRGFAHATLGHYKEASSDADTAVQRIAPNAPPNQRLSLLFNAACVQAQAAGRARQDLNSPTASDLANQYEQCAIMRLQEAFALLPARTRGPFARQMTGDPSLDPIRHLPNYKKLMESLTSPPSKK